MPAYQSDYIDFYYSVMSEVNELTRIKVHERIKAFLKRTWFSFKSFIKYEVVGRIKGYYIRLKKQLFPPKKRQFQTMKWQPERSSDDVRACISAPRKSYFHDEPMDEKISLSQYAYGKMLDNKFKKRFIDSANYRSRESIYQLKAEAVKYIYKQKLDESVLLRIAVFLHFT